MKFDGRWVIFVGSLFCNSPVIDAVTKYACVSFDNGIRGGINTGYGGIGDGDNFGFDSSQNSASSEEFGMDIGGYGSVQHGISPPGSLQGGANPYSFSPGTSPLEVMQGAGGLAAQNTGVGTVSGLPNTAASLGGASHIQQDPNTASMVGQMPVNKVAPGHPGVFLSGSLSCADRPGTTILITKLVYGNGGIYSCSSPDQNCDIVDYKDQEITPFCDGQVKCMVRTTGKLLPGCSVTSNFVHIEYECINPWSSFDICKDLKTVVRQPEVFIMSPSFFQGESPPSKTCECILKGRYDNRIMAQYVHTDIYQASNQSCSESFVLFESKLSPNQTELDKTTEVCGRRSLNNYLYKGDLRITFKDVDSGSKSGFVSKLLVPAVGIGVQNEIAMECGPVRLPGEPTPSPDMMNQNHGGMPNPFGPFSPMGSMNPQFQQSPRIPAPPVFEGIQTQGNTWGVPPRAMASGHMNWGGVQNWGGPPFPHPRFTSGTQDAQSTTSAPPAAWSRNQNPPAQGQNSHQVHFMGSNRRATAAPVAPNPYGVTIHNAQNRGLNPRRSRFEGKDVVIESKGTSTEKTVANNMVGYVIGGIGAVMTAFCALFISIYCTRRRQRILERRASERSESMTESPIYSLSPAEDHVHPMQKCGSGHVNDAFDDKGAGGETSEGSVYFENVDLNEDNYLSLEEVEEGRHQIVEDDVTSVDAAEIPLEERINSKYCLVQESKTEYDNNV